LQAELINSLNLSKNLIAEDKTLAALKSRLRGMEEALMAKRFAARAAFAYA